MLARLGTDGDAISAYVTFGGFAVLCIAVGAKLCWRLFYVMALVSVVLGLFFANDAGNRQHDRQVAAEAKADECQVVFNYVNRHPSATANHCDNARPTVWVQSKTCSKMQLPLAYRVTKHPNQDAAESVELGITSMNGEPLDAHVWLSWPQISELIDTVCSG